MSYSQAWLEDPNSIRGILVEVTVKDLLGAYGTAGSEVVIYLSNIGYITSNAAVSYLPYLVGSLQTTESLSIDGGLSMTFGDIEVSNSNGERDDWLDSTKFIWVNRPIQVYLGDPRWACIDIASVHSTFELVFDGVVSDIDSSSRETLNIKIRDKLQRLNVPLTEHTLGTYGVWAGGQSNQDTVRPVIFGEVFNISPLLVNPSILEYMFNDGISESVLEIRDNGAPVYTNASIYSGNNGAIPSQVTVNLSLGTFTLLKPSTGTITASIQGVKRSVDLNTGNILEGVYSNNIANIVSLIVTQYGAVSTRLTAAELDLLNLRSFASSNSAGIGVAILDKANILTACQELLASAYAQMYMTRKGKLQLLQLGIPTTDPLVYINDTHILFHSLNIVSKTEVVAATKIGYCRNYTPQTSLVASLPGVHNTLFKEEWYSSTVVDSSVQAAYKLTTIPEQQDTLLINTADAVAFATRLNNYSKVPKIVYGFTGSAELLSLKLGQQVHLTHNRFGLSVGKLAQVVSLSPNWVEGTINIEVII